MSDVQNLSTKILDLIQKEFPEPVSQENIDTIRRSVGLVLSSVHMMLLSTAKTNEEQENAVSICFQSTQSLMECLVIDCKRFGIDCQIETGRIVEDEGNSRLIIDSELN